MRALWVQVLFHSPPGVLFTFPSRYWFTIGGGVYLALGGGPPRFPQDSSCLVVLGYQQQHNKTIVRDSHPLWCAVPGSFQKPYHVRLASTAKMTRSQHNTPSEERAKCLLNARLQGSLVDPTTPTCRHIGLGSSPVARRYWGNHVCFLFLRVLRCFSFPRVPLHLSG